MWWLKFRMYMLLAVLFGIVYAIVVVISNSLGIGNIYFYLGVSLVMMLIQYMIGPKLVEWSMAVKYPAQSEYPKLHQMVAEIARRAGIPTPRVGIANINIPNAFAFGRGLRDGRVCVTRGIMQLLDEDELRAVLGHEMTHLKSRDVLTITLLSVIPMVLYYISRQLMFAGYGGRRDRQSNLALIGLAAFIFYFITNLLVLYASRIREYFADRGSVALGSQPSYLASALYKLVYGSARMPKDALKDAEGMKAFFVNDPSRARFEIRELSQLDLDKSGTIDQSELQNLRTKTVKLNIGDRLLEVLSTHPNMVKRIKELSASNMRGE